jgi:anti-anti-sigma factor
VSTTADIALERRDGVVIARLHGEVDMTNSSYVGEELRQAVPNEAEGLVLDLEETRYLDSAAIEVLFDLARRLGRRRQWLRLVMPPESPLKRVLLLTDVNSVAPLRDTLEAALDEG